LPSLNDQTQLTLELGEWPTVILQGRSYFKDIVQIKGRNYREKRVSRGYYNYEDTELSEFGVYKYLKRVPYGQKVFKF